METESVKKEKRKWFTPSNIIAIISVLISIVATILITGYFRDKKELTINVTANEQIIQRSKSSESIDGLKIFYNNTELLTPSLFKISVKNTRNIDVLDSDFLSQFIITLDDILIYDCYVTSELSTDIVEEINNSISINKNEIIIKKFTLLKGEDYIISLITDKPISKLDANARIKGISKINVFFSTNEALKSVSIFIGGVIGFTIIIFKNIINYIKRRYMQKHKLSNQYY